LRRFVASAELLVLLIYGIWIYAGSDRMLFTFIVDKQNFVWKSVRTQQILQNPVIGYNSTIPVNDFDFSDGCKLVFGIIG